MRTALLIFCLFFCTLFHQGQAATAENLRLNLVTDDHFPPFSHLEDGRATGLDLEVVEELGRRAGFVPLVKLTPWKRLLMLLENGGADGGFSLFRTPERELYADFCLAHPIHYSTYVVFVQRGRAFPFQTIEDLHGRRYGLNAGFKVSEDFDRAAELGLLETQEVEGVDFNIKKLLLGRIDAFIANKHVALYHADQSGMAQKLEFLPRPVKERRGAFLALSKKSPVYQRHPELKARIEAALSAMAADGTFAAIEAKHIP